MDPRRFIFIPIFCLLIAVAVASEPGTGRSRVAGSSAQETTLRTAPAANAWETNTNATATAMASSSSLAEDSVGRGHAPRTLGERERVEPTVNDQRDEEEQEDEEGEEEEEEEEEGKKDYAGEDEYEDELKAVAESHEAMSRDDTRNSNVSAVAAALVVDDEPAGGKNFDSHEVITVNDSDEDIASNEAITDELVDKYDQEVAELLKYKKERKEGRESRTKTKRVPTVKKELSTQREILVGGNETQVPKSLVRPEDTLNRLNEDVEAVRRRNVGPNGSINLENSGYSERTSGEGETVVDNRYSEQESESPKKFDKRQETASKDLKSDDQLGDREDARVENFVKVWAKLVDELSSLQKLLLDKFVKDSAVKRTYDSTSTLFLPTTESSSGSRKSRKKLKKKKKTPRHRFSTTTLTPVPATPPLLTTTETPWQTTPVQWRLVAERLFGPTWQHDLQQESPRKATDSRYSTQNSRNRPTFRDLIERNRPKSNLKPFSTERKPVFGKIDGLENGPVDDPRELVNVYGRPAVPIRIPDYDAAESYQRLRYNQLPPVSRNFLRRQDDDYPSDFNVQADNPNYEPPSRDFSSSKSWPDVSYRYSPPRRMEERPLLPIASEKWPWRQSSNDETYWTQRGKFLPVEKSYWSPLINEEDDEEGDREPEISQQPRMHHSWDRNRSAWPVENAAKLSPPWHQGERSLIVYDRDQSNGSWGKTVNRTDPNRSSMKQEAKEKVVLPQITMKTWNSLTSDPATWPHKLPGAKPWPKDENGKSYNPNAELVKKLGLDKQENGAWSKEETEKSNGEGKLKEEKQNRLFGSKESPREEKVQESEASSYKSVGDRSNLNDYKIKSGESKPWAILAESKQSKDWIKSESMQDDDAWRRKHDDKKSSWTNEASLPKIQSVGAWVMSADQSTWKPYQIKSAELPDHDDNEDNDDNDDDDHNDDSSRRWSKTIGRSSTDAKWSGKGSWSEKVNDSWMDRSESGLWPDEKNVVEPWKVGKPGSWFAKSSKIKEGGEWLSKPDSSWTSKIGDNDSWPGKGNGGSWSTRANKSWTSKTNDDVSKSNGDSWPIKVKEDVGDTWPRKTTDQNGWSSKSNELSPWQQKINDAWSYGKSSTGSWPSKWKQFAYHRVTAMPISKPGTTADAASAKSKNAFVAVSAVSSSRYAGNEWRKTDEDGRNENGRPGTEDQERSGNQVQVGLERPIYAWKKDAAGLRTSSTKGNTTDPLENELEALRQIDFWSYKENEAEKRLTTTGAGTEKTSTISTNSTTAQRRTAGLAAGNGLVETNRRTISMK